MGMGFGGAAAMAGGPAGAVLRRVPDGLPVQVQPLAGRNIGGFAAWRDWDNGGQQRPEDHRQPPHRALIPHSPPSPRPTLRLLSVHGFPRPTSPRNNAFCFSKSHVFHWLRQGNVQTVISFLFFFFLDRFFNQWSWGDITASYHTVLLYYSYIILVQYSSILWYIIAVRYISTKYFTTRTL